MEFWPAISSPPARNTASKSTQKSKATSREAAEWTNYPVVNHGSLTAATMVKVGDSFQWSFVQSEQSSDELKQVSRMHINIVISGQLRQLGQITKVFPVTRPPPVSNTEMGLNQRAQQGVSELNSTFL